MDQKSIGEYLRRLRVRAKYTQSELGARIGVSDKAISRWESGVGMPEISNLMELAKLYEITVDDILNLNESVFVEPQEASDTVNAETEQKDVAPSAEQKNTVGPVEYADGACVKVAQNNILSERSFEFRVILLFLYFMVGAFVVRDLYEYAGGVSIWLFIVFTAIVIASTVTGILRRFRPKSCRIADIAIFSLATAAPLGFDLIYMGADVPLLFVVSIVFTLLFAMQLLYEISDFVKSERVKKISAYCNIGIATGAVVCAVIYCAINCKDNIYLTDIALVFTTLCALLFALSARLTKWINVLTALVFLVYAAFCIIGQGVECLQETPIYQHEIFSSAANIGTGLIACALASIMIGRFFNGYKTELRAVRITSAVAFALTIPVYVFAIDSFAVNVILGTGSLAAASFMRITILVAVSLACVKLFRVDLLAEQIRKGRKAK